MIIALDIGGTKIAAALIDENQPDDSEAGKLRVIERRTIASPVHGDLQQLLPTLESLCDDWLDQLNGIGIATTGLVSDDEVYFISVGADQRLAMKAQLQASFAVPVVVLNDAWAAAWAEYCLGGHAAAKTLVYLTLSTGIGGGIVCDGQLLTSHRGFAGHLGHLNIPRADGASFGCSCGRVNCIEAIASGTAIGRRASQLLGRSIDCQQVFEQATDNPELDALLDDCAAATAEAIGNIKAVTDTDVLVIGGSVGLATGYLQRIQAAVDHMPAQYQTQLSTATLGKAAELTGAALAIAEHISQ